MLQVKVRHVLDNKNQFWLITNDGNYFQSYNSVCAHIDNNGELILGKDWDYSRTTLKHLYAFLDENRYTVNSRVRGFLKQLNESKNKKAYLQSLINIGVVLYDEGMI